MSDADHTHVERIPIIDVDVHTAVPPMLPELTRYLPARWQRHIETVGFRGMSLCGERPRQRPFAARTDAWTPEGGAPGSDPAFAREQLLDRYDISAAIMNDIFCYQAAGGRAYPEELAAELARAYNDYRRDTWLAADPRWYGSITMPYETRAAADEIRRCKESEHGARWVQVMMAPDNERPAGNPRYWPIYEAAEHYGIPVSFHVLASRRVTGTGVPNFYLEEHTQFADTNFPLVASLVFEGVFDRFPNLKIGMIELGWSWAVPFAWRLDRTYRLLRDEVAHLKRPPSEYLAEHFYFSTQPMEEPEHLGWVDDVYQLFEDTMGHKLMYSSDYPHWDFDEPTNLPAGLPPESRRRILGQTASELYNIPLRVNTGLAVAPALA